MTDLKLSSKPNSTVNKLVWLGMLLAFVGFLDATYLTTLHLLGGIPPCFASTRCEVVLTSKYAQVWGIPTAFFGIIFYTGMLGLFRYYTLKSERRLLTIASGLAGTGMTATAYFLYLQSSVIGAYCVYCLISAGLVSSLLVVCLYTLNLNK